MIFVGFDFWHKLGHVAKAISTVHLSKNPTIYLTNEIDEVLVGSI